MAIPSFFMRAKAAQPQVDPQKVGPKAKQSLLGTATPPSFRQQEGFQQNPANTYSPSPSVDLFSPVAEQNASSSFYAPDGSDLFAPIEHLDVPSPYEKLADKPHIVWFGDLIAQKKGEIDEAERYVNRALLGQNGDQQHQEDLDKANQERIQRLRDKAADFVQKASSLSDDEWKATIQRLHTEAQNRPQLEQPGLRMPSWQALALGLLGASVDGQHAGQILAAPFQAMQGQQQQDLDLARQRYQAQNEAWQSRVESAKQDVGFAQEGMERQYRGFMDQARLAGGQADDLARDGDRLAMAEDRRLNRQMREDQNADKNANVISGRYSAATKQGDMLRFAKEYNQTVDPDGTKPGLRITDEDVARDYAEKRRDRAEKASAQFSKELHEAYNFFGEMDPLDLKSFVQRRKDLADLYDVEEKDLPKILTGASLKDDALAMRKAEFAEKMKQASTNQAQNIAIRRANLDLATRRLAQLTSNQRFMQGIAMGNLAATQARDSAIKEYRQAELDLRKRLGDAKLAIGDTKQTGDIRALDLKIIDARKHLGNPKTDAKTQAEIDGLVAQRQYLVSLLPQPLQDQDLLANIGPMLGGPTGVPQIYQQPQAPVTINVGGPQGVIGQQPLTGQGTARSVPSLAYAGKNDPNKVVKFGKLNKTIAQHIADANKAIQSGADPAQVKQQLAAMGITAR